MTFKLDMEKGALTAHLLSKSKLTVHFHLLTFHDERLSLQPDCGGSEVELRGVILSERQPTCLLSLQPDDPSIHLYNGSPPVHLFSLFNLKILQNLEVSFTIQPFYLDLSLTSTRYFHSFL